MKKLALSNCLQTALLNAPSKKVNEEIRAIYEDTVIAEKIPIKYSNVIEDKRYKDKIIYESYKPKNLKSIMDYMNFCLMFRNTLPTKISSYKSSNQSNTIEAIMHKSIVTDFFQLASVSDELKEYYNADMQNNLPIQVNQEKILVFDSNFESGNLDKVSIGSLNEYNLFLRADTNTRGHCQWFYFAVTNTYKGEKVTFNVLNCTKPVGLFKKEMIPLVFSEIEYERAKVGWIQDTYDTVYNKSSVLKEEHEDLVNEKQSISRFYSLKFSYEFKHTGDKVYFAFGRPYTLSMHFALLNKIKEDFFEGNAKITHIESNTLQQKIKQFITTPPEPTEDSSLKKRRGKFTVKKDKAQSYIPQEVFKEYSTANIQTFDWMKCEEYQVEREDIIYKQEMLCRSFCGIPIVLLTITNSKYVFE